MKLPVVAIVGRTNVGKSTFFNRAIRRREAIVDDMPGVTRDRNYAVCEWSGKQFVLVDTGGYVPGTTDIIEKAVLEQAQQAIKEARVIIFMLDATTGLNTLDEEIASILRKLGKDVLLAINKVDNDQRQEILPDFYRLALGAPQPISAISGRGFGDFLDLVISFLPDRSQAEATSIEEIRLAVLGRPNVGKSSLVNAILGEDKLIVTEIPGTTRDAIDSHFKYYGQEFVLIDTAGLRKRARVKEDVEFYSNVRALEALHRCQVAIILIDATAGLLDQDKKIIDLVIKEYRGTVLAVNKWDLVPKDTMTAKRLEDEIKRKLGKSDFLPILFISALTGQRIHRVIEVAKAVFEERRKRVPTAELNKFLKQVLLQHPPPAFGQKWVKINYCSQVRASPPVFVFFTNEPEGIKKNYKTYLENQLRQQFGFAGVPIRLQFRKK